jgi:MAF protein
MKIVLASTSKYRKQILEKLQIPFSCVAPNVDETSLSNESASALVERLAISKAHAAGENIKDAFIIGSDQVASLNGKILGKPGNYARAFEQLKDSSGHSVMFHTGLCIFDSRQQTTLSRVENFAVTFKNLSDQQINTYLRAEKPFDCAGSFKSEGLGIMLFNELKGRDPNTLVGLPLILLTELFSEAGIDLFEHIDFV